MRMDDVPPKARICAAILVLAVLAATSDMYGAAADAWPSRPASPAVVNPVVRSELQEVISLRGEWDFTTDPKAVGQADGWMQPKAAWSGKRSIEVPGCWEAQGVGQPGMSVTWDCHWDCVSRPLPHVYMGSAWYRRTVVIPDTWQGKRVWLKIGGVRAQGWFWVNGQPVAHLETYCGTYKYDVTDLVAPGQEAVVVALVRNDVPGRSGCLTVCHRFGGLYRDVELEATPSIWIDNCWVQGDFDRRLAVVRLAIRTVAGENAKSISADVSLRTLDGQPAGQITREIALGEKGTAEVACDVPLSVFRPWSPDKPDLYVADVKLRDGNRVIHGWQERFGVRKFEVRGDRFYFNDKPFFVRAYGDDFIYPETLISPTSREFHRKHLEIARRSGFVYVRLHTHCEWPEFFEAADEAGILLQPELPYYREHPTEAFSFDPKRDLAELITHYQRHVSLATCCMGNEGHLGSPVDRELYELAKRMNPSLLILHQDGGKNTPENSDFRSGPIIPWKPGSFVKSKPGEPFFGNQYIDGYVQGAPYIAHEYLNLGLKCDPRLEPRFTGTIASPRDMKTYEASLRRVGLNRAWGDACLDAGHALQRFYQKQGLELARLDPTCDGYCFWTIIDVLVKQGDTYTGQGLYNAFWEPKPGGATPDDFRKFNDATAILVQLEPEAPIAVSGQTIGCAWWISHFGNTALKGAKLAWALRDGSNVLASGSLDKLDVALGDVRELGKIQLTVPDLSHPTHAVLSAKLEGTGVENQWDLWLFPKRASKPGNRLAASAELFETLSPRYPGMAKVGTPEAKAAEILLTTSRDKDTLEALEAGRRVVLLDLGNREPNVSLGWWWIGNQTGAAMAKHRVFGDFPHSGHLSPLWFRLVKRVAPIQPGDEFQGAEPLMVGEGSAGYSIYVSQAQAGKGRLLLASGLDVIADTPEGVWLLDAMLDYVQGNAFAPKGKLDFDRLVNRWRLQREALTGLNGWGRTLKSTLTCGGNYFCGPSQISILYFADRASRLGDARQTVYFESGGRTWPRGFVDRAPREEFL